MAEDIKEETTSPEPAQEEIKEESSEESVETPKEDSSSINYEAELKKLREAKDKAEYAAKELRLKNSELKRQDRQDHQGQDEYVDSSKEDLEEVINSRFQELETKILGTRVRDEISKLASTDAEAELIKYNYENTIRPTGDIVHDVQTAKFLANRARYEQENAEIKRAVASQQNRGSGSGAGAKETSYSEQSISESDAKWLGLQGLKFNPSTGYYEGTKVRGRFNKGVWESEAK